jgi:hypothetical protein
MGSTSRVVPVCSFSDTANTKNGQKDKVCDLPSRVTRHYTVYTYIYFIYTFCTVLVYSTCEYCRNVSVLIAKCNKEIPVRVGTVSAPSTALQLNMLLYAVSYVLLAFTAGALAYNLLLFVRLLAVVYNNNCLN